MKPAKSLELKKFCIAWITKVVSTRKSYQQKLINAIEDLFPDDIERYDGYSMLDVADWDNVEEHIDPNTGRKHRYCGMGDRLKELNEWENIWDLTKKGQNDLSCTIRIGIDLLIYQSCGVVGYTVGDLRRVFDGKIPDDILKQFKHPKKLMKAKDNEPIWL